MENVTDNTILFYWKQAPFPGLDNSSNIEYKTFIYEGPLKKEEFGSFL